MKVRVLLDPEKPKVPRAKVEAAVRAAGLEVAGDGADIGLAVGGDGVFGSFGRTESLPLLFVGVRSSRPTGSKAYLAGADYDDLPAVLRRLKAGRYRVREWKRMSASIAGKPAGDFFTDAYLERGADSHCIRYRLTVTEGKRRISEAAIANGVIVSTGAGASGYYSYMDKLRPRGALNPLGHSSIPRGRVGVCHVLPTFIKREGTDERVVRYTVGWGSRIAITLTRGGDARLFGLGPDRGGLRVMAGDSVAFGPGTSVTRTVEVPVRGLANA